MTTSTHGIPFDAEQMIEKLAEGTAEGVRELGRRGAVVAVSGGVDSGVAAALSVRGLGREHVLLLRLPERDIGASASDLGLSSPRRSARRATRSRSRPRSRRSAATAAATRRSARSSPTTSPTGSTSSCARRRPAAIIVFSLVVERPDGDRRSSADARRPPTAQLIAATNMKQRVRKLIEYTWADRLGYAVIGTPNRLEYDQGSSSRAATASPTSSRSPSLYKTQVYALARALGLPEAIAARVADDRDLQPAADAGGVLLRPSRTSGWTCSCGAARQRHRAGRAGRRWSASNRRRGRGRLRGDRTPPRRDRYLHAARRARCEPRGAT